MRDDTVPSPSTDEQPLNDVFGLLSERRRRRAVSFLAGAETAASLSEVAAAVAAREAAPGDVTADARDRIAVTLHHNHLPKLDAAGVVDYDPERGVVTPTGIEAVASLLPTTDADEE